MKSTGEKIKLLRNALGLSQEQLSEIIEVTPKSIYRYETGKFLPDVSTLARLATFFDVSTDYLLGLSGLKKQMQEEHGKIHKAGKYNAIYKHYLQRKDNPNFDKGETYFWIFSQNINGSIEFGGQTEWCGWADDGHTIEIRKLRPIDPNATYMVCSKAYAKPMIITDGYDAGVFHIFGGQAIVSEKTCKEFFPEFIEFRDENPEQNLSAITEDSFLKLC